jgi:RecJ-like exonuclease
MEKLTKITFSISLIGVLLLLFIANRAEPELIYIEDITETMINQQVKIIAEISMIRNMDEFQVIMVKDETGIIDVTANSKAPMNKTDNEVMIIGKVSEYEGELQINANKIIEILD